MKTTRITLALSLLLAASVAKAATAASDGPTLPAAPTTTTFADTTAQLRKLIDEQQNNANHASNLTVAQVNALMASPDFKQERSAEEISTEIKTLITSLVAQDPKAAIAWAQSMPSQENWLDPVVRAWASTDPVSAAHFAASSQDMNWLESTVADTWPRNDYLAELTWAESLPEGWTRQMAVGSSLFHMALFDAPGAWVRAIRYVGKPNYDGIYTRIISSWAETDPLTAAKAMASVPDGTFGNLTQNITDILISGWVRRDPAAVIVWAKSLPAGDLSKAVRLRLNIETLANAHGGALVSTGATIITADDTAINKFTGNIRPNMNGSKSPYSPIKPITADSQIPAATPQ
jgi:hypothetical protein